MLVVSWTPHAVGSMTGSLTFTDNAPNSPQVVSLSGVGVLPAVAIAPTKLIFSTQVVFTTSGAQTAMLTNTGLGILSIAKISVTGPFSQTNTCGTSVAARASCTFTATFKPTTIGALAGAISITDNAGNSPQSVVLTGFGTYVRLNPTSLKFGNQPVGTKSLPKRITLSNKGSVAVSITEIAFTGTNAADFAETNTCGTTVAAGASCFIQVTFTPSAKGNRTATLSVTDNGGGSPQKVSVGGTGT
jgi:trimeric autotransporter adhesin